MVAALLVATLERCDAALDRIISLDELLIIRTTPSSVEMLLCSKRMLLGTVTLDDDEPISDDVVEGADVHAKSVNKRAAVIVKDRVFGIWTIGNECV